MNNLKSLLDSLLAIEESASNDKEDKKSESCDCKSYDCQVCYPDDVNEDEETEDELVESSFGLDDDSEFDSHEVDEEDFDELSDDMSLDNGLPDTLGEESDDRYPDTDPTSVLYPRNGEVDADDVDFGKSNASEDVSDLIAQIEYVQDLGISNSSTTYSTDQLMNMSSEMVQRIYDKVVNGESEPVYESDCIVDNREDGMVFLTRGHRKVKIAPVAGGFQVLQLSGKLIDQATSKEEAVEIGKRFLNSPITESRIKFDSYEIAKQAARVVQEYGYRGYKVEGNVLEVQAPELVVDRLADKFDGSVEYEFDEMSSGSVAIAMEGGEERIDELDHDSFRTDEKLAELRDAIDKNVLVSVAFVKKDGSVKHMTVKRSLSSYVASTAPKTDKQLNVEKNHNLKRVVDINAYIKALKANKAVGMEEDDAKAAAAKVAWRSINLGDVLGFMVRGKFIDLRDENEILSRYGEDTYNSLTPSMKSAMSQSQNVTEDFLVENGFV